MSPGLVGQKLAIEHDLHAVERDFAFVVDTSVEAMTAVNAGPGADKALVEAVELVGHAVGGVCPFALKEGVTVYLDESLERFETVFPACGSGISAIELTVDELEKYSNCSDWVDVCKLPEAEL